MSREVLHAGSGILRALIKNMAAGNIFHSSIESGFKMAINSGVSGLHVKLMMDPCLTSPYILFKKWCFYSHRIIKIGKENRKTKQTQLLPRAREREV